NKEPSTQMVQHGCLRKSSQTSRNAGAFALNERATDGITMSTTEARPLVAQNRTASKAKSAVGVQAAIRVSAKRRNLAICAASNWPAIRAVEFVRCSASGPFRKRDEPAIIRNK